MKFTELVRLLEKNGFKMIKQKGSIRYYGKSGCDKLVQVDKKRKRGQLGKKGTDLFFF